MKKLGILAFVLLVFAATAVAQDVRYNFAQDVDFSKFKTYKWVEVKGADQANAITQTICSASGTAPNGQCSRRRSM